MKRILLLSLSLFMLSCFMRSQDLNKTFTADDGSSTIDEVTATNLTTDDSVTMPGDETLILHSIATRIKKIPLEGDVTISPNPYSSNAHLYFSSSKNMNATIRIMTPDGKVVNSRKMSLNTGSHDLRISCPTPGFYIVSVTTQEGTVSTKVIQKNSGMNEIEHIGSKGNVEIKQETGLKAANTTYVLDFTPGDIISYTIKSGDNITIVNENPAESGSSAITATIVTCKDNNNINYKTVKIGDQIWMAENLRSTRYADGDAIPYVASDADWKALSDDYHDQDRAYCYGDYGNLYTWAAAMDGDDGSSAVPSGIQGVCPDGWHLPSYNEFLQMSDFLGGAKAASAKLKETGTTHWDSPNSNATNESGFNALPAGYRDHYYGTYEYVGSATYWWATNRASTSLAYSWTILLDYDLEESNVKQSRGASVRCVKD